MILVHSHPLLTMSLTQLILLDRQKQKGHFNSYVHVSYSDGGCFTLVLGFVFFLLCFVVFVCPG